MYKLSVPRYNGRLFDWINGVGHGEASEMRRGWSRLYADACDVGFEVESHRTGNVETFALHHVEYGKNGDDCEILYWLFARTDITRKVVKIIVFND